MNPTTTGAGAPPPGPPSDGAPPPGKKWIYPKWITRKNGKRDYASSHGLKSWRIAVHDNENRPTCSSSVGVAKADRGLQVAHASGLVNIKRRRVRKVDPNQLSLAFANDNMTPLKAD